MQINFSKANKRLLIVSLGCFISSFALAHEFLDIHTTCYQFNQDKVVKQQKCTVISGGGAGGESEQFIVGEKSYEFTTSWDYQEKQDTYEPRLSYTVTKGSQGFSYPADIYYRDKKTLKKLGDKDNLDSNKSLICYLVPSHHIDVCRGN